MIKNWIKGEKGATPPDFYLQTAAESKESRENRKKLELSARI